MNKMAIESRTDVSSSSSSLRVTRSLIERNISFRKKGILEARSMPILIVAICFLIMANSRCDQVGSTNAIELSRSGFSTDDWTSTSASALISALQSRSVAKYDPFDLIREIYLDDKIITILDSPNSNTVQKFHPNGRYGRRSVNNNLVEPQSTYHTELGKLIKGSDRMSDGGLETKDDHHPLASILNRLAQDSGARYVSQKQQDQLKKNDEPFRWHPINRQPSGDTKMQDPINYKQELDKLLKCNFSGLSNLFWCNSY